MPALNALNAYTEALSTRAFTEGSAAFFAGQPRQAPERFLTFSGKYVEGWISAQLQTLERKAA